MKLEIIAEAPDLMPVKKNEEDACFDLKASKDCVVPAVGSAIIPTGLKMNIPSGFYGEIRGRSGLAFNHNVFAFHGTVDCGFIDTVNVLLTNNNVEPFHISRGDRIAQFKLTKIEPTEIAEVDSFGDVFDRGGGFGHSGMR